MSNEHLYFQPNQIRCAGLRDDDKGSEVTCFHPDGTITFEPATYWYDICRDRRREYGLRGNRNKWKY